jgi:hypothetical protein
MKCLLTLQATRRLADNHIRVLNFHRNQPGVLRDINRCVCVCVCVCVSMCRTLPLAFP